MNRYLSENFRQHERRMGAEIGPNFSCCITIEKNRLKNGMGHFFGTHFDSLGQLLSGKAKQTAKN